MKLLKEEAAADTQGNWSKLFQALKLDHTDFTLLRIQTAINNTKCRIWYCKTGSIFPLEKKKQSPTHVKGYKEMGKKKKTDKALLF